MIDSNIRMVFRVDANEVIGRGHLSRLLSIAEMLCEYYPIVFICHKSSEVFCSDYMSRYCFVFIENDIELYDYLSKVDLLFADGYQFGNDWRIEFQKIARGLVYVDDFCEDIRGADIILNHTPGITLNHFDSTYKDVEYHLGLEYSMIRSHFIDYARSYSHDSGGHGVFVSFGGADPLNLCQRFVDELLSSGFSDPIYVVGKLGGSYPNFPNIQHFRNLDVNEMSRCIKLSKVLLVPASIISFEGMALRKPIYAVYYADNQELNYKGMVAMQLAYGGGRVISALDVKEVIEDFIGFYANRQLHTELVAREAIKVDGNSGKRITAIIGDFLNRRH